MISSLPHWSLGVFCYSFPFVIGSQPHTTVVGSATRQDFYLWKFSKACVAVQRVTGSGAQVFCSRRACLPGVSALHCGPGSCLRSGLLSPWTSWRATCVRSGVWCAERSAESPTAALLSVSPVSCVTVCLRYSGAPGLGTSMFTMVASSR